MKFIVDAHLPRSLCRVLRAGGHDAVHTSQLPARNRTSDEAIGALARREGRALITKDAGFYDSLLLRGEPPQLVLVRVGNCRKSDLIALFERRLRRVVEALKKHDLVELHREELRYG